VRQASACGGLQPANFGVQDIPSRLPSRLALKRSDSHARN
jgi:hypothetical protein